MKLKQSKGMSLIVFTIVLSILVVLAGGVIVYLLNNPVKEKVSIQNPTNVENMNFSAKAEENVIEKTEIITNENLYNMIEGLYEYEVTETNLGEDYNDNYLFRLQLFENGTFRYEYMPGKRSCNWFYR